MIRLAFILLVAVALAALLTRAAAPRWLLFGLLGLMVVYSILKLAGVIEAPASSRSGGIMLPYFQAAVI